MSDLFGHTPKNKKKPPSKKKTTAKAKEPVKKAAKKAVSKKTPAGGKGGYSAKDIEVLEGLEPVRKRPGMYIGGTDAHAMHHLVAEVMDNSMDEAVAGHASRIEIKLDVGDRVTITDNGRGIPTDPHPKFKTISALEVILTTLHSGGKFSNKVYETSGGLHGVGLSVVNALADELTVEVARDKKIWTQTYARGKPKGKLKATGKAQNRRGTAITFHPDPDIFGKDAHFTPEHLFRMARSKAYLFKGVEIRWSCDKKLLKGVEGIPEKATLHFPGGMADYLTFTLGELDTVTVEPFADEARFRGNGEDHPGKVEWAVHWLEDGDEDDAFFNSYCNTVPTPLGGTHESGFRSALAKGIRAYGELINNKQAKKITADDVFSAAAVMISAFIPNPQFQGQTKERLTTTDAAKWVEATVRDHFDHWLTGHPEQAGDLLDAIIERAEARMQKRADKPLKRQSATRKLRLPGKLSDCSKSTADGTEIFLVEGDSAGGSAKQARRRETQAVLPLRGKILNVASATDDKLRANQELSDLIEALGCGTRKNYDESKLRYERVVIMTDADVDGAHIASLLMTFFFKEMTNLVKGGHLFLAQPPLYRLSQGGRVAYAMDDADKDVLMETEFKNRGKVEISRFKGLGEMPPAQLKETTMNPDTRTMVRVNLPGNKSDAEKRAAKETSRLVESLMGRKPEKRYEYITEHGQFVEDLDI